jgi:uncharacterized protein YutE (UPF0331/DUF86 family)
LNIEAPNHYELNLETLEHDFSSHDNLTDKIPHKLRAEDFLSFAEDDMKGDTDRDIVNALSNLKRAIENRMDSLLFVFRYHKLARHLSFPDKMKKLNKLGIVAPRILSKINKIRNLLEHQYQIPQKNDIEEAYDVAILFLAYTKRFITDFISFGHFSLDGKESKNYDIRFEFRKDSLEIQLDNIKRDIKATNAVFDEWVKLLVAIYY